MFKSTRWRSEKNKIKAIFKLQFQVTQVPKLGWDTAMVTLVPMDTGRPTSRSEKSPVIDGECQWVKAIYETVKLSHDPRNGKIHDKVYQFVVSATGPKSALLGEITVNLAEYPDAIKPTSISLPLRTSNSGAIILHVTLQRMQADVDKSEFDGNGEITVRKPRRTLESQLSTGDNKDDYKVANGVNDNSSREDALFTNSHAQMKFPSSRNIPLHTDSIANLKKSSSFDAISASGSDSSGQFTPKDSGVKNNIICQQSASFLSPLSNSNTPRKAMNTSGDSATNVSWSISSAQTEGSTNNSGENGSRSQESDDSLDKLSEVVALKRQLEVSQLELQTLRKQVVKENRRAQELTRELSGLKVGRGAFRREAEEHNSSRQNLNENEIIPNKLQLDGEDPWSMIEEIRQELNHEKSLNANLRLQLEKTQESNSELILAVSDLEELLEQKKCQIACTGMNLVPIKPGSNRDIKQEGLGNGFTYNTKQELFQITPENEEQYALGVFVKEKDDVKAAHALEQRIIDLNGMVELYKKDREEIEMQMEQLALDYEILKQEHHDISSKLEQTQLREQLRMQYECSAHFAIINDLEAHIERLEKELQEQAESFEADLESIANAKVQHEKMAIQTEEELRKTRSSNAHNAGHLQMEFKQLSAQMSSMFHVNQKLVMDALAESSELRLQKRHMEQMLAKANKELASVKGQCQVKFQQLLRLIDFKTKEADGLFLELRDKQVELKNQRQLEEKKLKSLSEEIVLLKAEMENLSKEKHHLSEQVEHKEKLVTEMEEMKTLVNQHEMLLQESNLEINMLRAELTSTKEEAAHSLQELNNLRNTKDENETIIRNLNSELASVKVQYKELKNTLVKDESINKNLMQMVSQLKEDIQKKEGMIIGLEKKIEYRNADPTDPEGVKITTTRNKDAKFSTEPHNCLEIATLYGEIQLCTDECRPEKNILNVSISDVRNDGCSLQQIRMKNKACTCGTNTTERELSTSNLGGDEENDQEIYSNLGGDEAIDQEIFSSSAHNEPRIGEVQSEIAMLKARNQLMEAELKEMQDRYSELSLKFAEVEGERQQLVMSVRSLRNALKT